LPPQVGEGKLPILNHAGSSDMVVLIADLMGGPKEPCQLLLVSTKLRPHILRTDEFFVMFFPWR
jgi:hypothetical protein